MKSLIIILVLLVVGLALVRKWQTSNHWFKSLVLALPGAWVLMRQLKKQQQEFARARSEGAQAARETAQPSDSGVRINVMLPCERCGVHVPETEGVRVEGRFYCCAEHAR